MARFEHIGINVPDARAMANWYKENLYVNILKKIDEPPYTHFLGDSTGRVFLEIYTNHNAPIPDYHKQDPLIFHIAFESANPENLAKKLIDKGATMVEKVTPDNQSLLIMLRDPWGIPLQICKRSQPFVLPEAVVTYSSKDKN